jgi:hypothetical protein
VNPDQTTVDDLAPQSAGHHSTNEGGVDGVPPSPPGQESATPYWRFGAMIATSMIAMFVLTYVNTYEVGHIHFSETRMYMTFIMGAAMAVIMLSFMLGMYESRNVNAAIFAGSAIVFAIALVLMRSQATVEDRSYMRAMIPHHSIAILTSKNADIEDLRVRDLADRIIDAQEREITEMEWLIDDIGDHGVADSQEQADARPVPDFAADD